MRLVTSFISPGGTFFIILSGRFFSSGVAAAPTLKLKRLYARSRNRALAEAKLALTDYLHVTRTLPFILVDNIVSNSPVSLCSFVSQVPFDDATPTDFRRILRSFLSYHPVNEFEFFFESIGLPPSHPSLPSNTSLFLTEDDGLIAAVSSLLRYGFPWTLLGALYLNSPSIFSASPGHILQLLQRIEGLGFPSFCVIAICLTFPSALCATDYFVENEPLFHDLKALFVDYNLAGCAENDMEVFLRFCRRIRVFYDFGSQKGGLGELMGRNRRIFTEFDELVLAQKLRFLLELGLKAADVGPSALKNAEFFDLDLDNLDIVIPDYLICIGLNKVEANSLLKRYPYVTGKNKLGNLPGIIKALELNKWFLTKVMHEKGFDFLSPSYTSAPSCDNKSEIEFVQDIERIKMVKLQKYTCVKVEFFLSIGFGKNKKTSKAIGVVHANKKMLQGRFNCLIGLGIEHSMLCRMISSVPKLLNQSNDMLLEKVNYLRQVLGYPVEYLNCFPAFLLFDLENRVKPRYRILDWLRNNGLLKKPLAPGTVLANSEKRFISILSSIHPAAPKQWLECFSLFKDRYTDKESI